MSIGVPIKLLHEAQGHIITIELKTGSVYRGTLFEGKLQHQQYSTMNDNTLQ
jgi:small nuclear ribonucleoprotein D3